MSSEIYEVFEADYKHAYNEIRYGLTDQVSKCSGEEQKQLVRQLMRKSEEANRLLQEMENESRKAPAPFRTQMSSALRVHRRDMEQLLKELKLLAKSDQAERSSGYNVNYRYDDVHEDQSIESSQRARLMQGTQSLSRASDSIARSHAIAAETDQIGADIMEDLGTQRESLLRTRSRLGDTDQNLSRSRKIMNTMARRVMTNKLLLVVIILLEVIILGIVVWWKFFK